MGPTLSSETSVFELQTPGKFPEEDRLQGIHVLRQMQIPTG